MAFSLPLPHPLPSQGWKVKIRDRERTEEPHVTILHKTQAWRFGLRSGMPLDTDPLPSLVPREVVDAINANLELLCQKWDEMYPENPVRSKEDDDEG